MPGLAAALSLLFAFLLPAASSRTVVITFDDLPVISVLPLTPAQRDSITTGLLNAIAKHRIPAIGFVNENKLVDSTSGLDPARVALLRRWIGNRLELGNHTWSHPDLHRISLTEFEADVLRGDSVTGRLLAEAGRVPRFFRHPFLHTGRSVAIRDSLNQFLLAHGYRVAPVTIDNSDYVFAAAYDRTLARGDFASATRVRTSYLEYLDSVTVFYERQALAIVGRDLPQILLLHANRLNADTFDGVASMLERRGYRFIPIDRALQDSAYALPDRYAGPAGITWLHRWAITAGVPDSVFKGEPDVPDWVSRLSQPGQ